MPKALITGITGQDGSYLAELLLAKGYEVHGLVRRSSSFNTARIDHLYHDRHVAGTKLTLHFGDLLDDASMTDLLHRLHPDEVYNLGAQSHVRVSFDMPIYTAEAVAMGPARLLEAIRRVDAKGIRFYQAGSSEMFGSANPPQSETTPFQPRSPYAVAKVMAHYACINYREAYGVFAVNGILFNHESPRRGETFLTRKVTRAVGRIKAGLQEHLYLGNQDAKRDWGFAGDYVEAMWRMLQHDEPDDFVIATGESHSVREWVEGAFSRVGLDSDQYVKFDARYLRPSEVDHLLGDASKAREKLGWTPSCSFDELLTKMVDHDVALAREEALVAADRRTQAGA